MTTRAIQPRWYTVREVAQMLNFSVSKTKILIAEREIRSIKIGGSRRILPEWVDEFVTNQVEGAEDGWTFARSR
ncbi:helix-turn-helix domain-containing protein [Haloechinothrix salitolerans]|uniref:Helix-turn-helix domain-containing protein n=1 Tax=Haloechinothrix salitolerans TaxID=926830 RepID=A0ABW2C3M8_9PSEU